MLCTTINFPLLFERQIILLTGYINTSNCSNPTLHVIFLLAPTIKHRRGFETCAGEQGSDVGLGAGGPGLICMQRGFGTQTPETWGGGRSYFEATSYVFHLVCVTELKSILCNCAAK